MIQKLPCILLICFIVSGMQSPVFAESLKNSNESPEIGSNRPKHFIPGDALEIVSFPDTTAFPSGFYPIDGEGYVEFPVIGTVKVTGMTPDALSKMLAEKYVEFMRYPHMTIKPMIRVALNGGFYRPGLYWVDPKSTLWEVIQTGGGPQRKDGFQKLRWERSDTVVSEKVTTIIEEGQSLYQIGFKTGDQLTVLQQPHRTGWEVFRGDVIPLMTTTITIIISALTLYNTAQYYQNIP